MSRAPNKSLTEIEAAGAPRRFDHGGRSVTFVPLTIKRRHTRKLLVPPAGGQETMQARSFDLPMIRTIGRAFYWQRLLGNGDVKDAGELAERFKLDHPWVCEILNLTLLAPDILAAIVEGRQPRQLNLQAVRRGVPIEWEAQRKGLGFTAD